MKERDTENLITKTSSWPIVGGSIDDSITCESSVSGIDDDDDDGGVGLSVPAAPLVLRRPSPDSAHFPCEITIDFAQQHEIKQVYVRSTARVYEIYYASVAKGDNEYLCTVRCGVVVSNGKLLKETDAIGSLSASSHGSTNRWADERHPRTESGSNTSEDGWVDVKVPHSSGLDHGDSSLSKKNDGHAEQNNRDLFEATAEISDVDPVLSVTLRLLSIQSGDCICIDEVYVFADPFVSAIADSSAKMPQNSSGNAMMSMLVPTLLQLSKSQMSQKQERDVSAGGERWKHQTTETNLSGAAITYNALQSTKPDRTSINTPKPEVPLQTPYPGNCPRLTSAEFCSSHLERSLDELVSRVSKIELFCLRFEENLLKPISSIEARLIRIEQQLESSVKTPQFSRTACTKISAPEFSFNESESNSIGTNGIVYPSRKPKPTGRDDCLLEELPIKFSNVVSSACVVQSSGTSSTTVPQLSPSLIVTAPDFSNVDDEEENDNAEVEKDFPIDSLKKPLSINDALASAFAGFLSSTSMDSLEYSDKIEGPADCSNVEGSKDALPPVLIQTDAIALPSVLINDDKRTSSRSCKDLVLTKRESPAVDEDCLETLGAVDKQDSNFEKGSSKKPVDVSIDNLINLDKDEAVDSDLTAEFGSEEADEDLNNFPDTPALVAGALQENEFVATLEGCGDDINSKVAPELLHSMLKLPSAAVVDFKIPILDVKFLPLEDSSKSPLEALLMDAPGLLSKVPSVKENPASSFSDQNNLVMIENEESATTGKDFQLCSGNCDFGYSSYMEEQELLDLHEYSSQDMRENFI